MKKSVHSSLYRQIARYEPLKLEQIVDLQISPQQMNQSKNNVPSINKKPIPITPDSLFIGFSNPKTFHLHRMPPTPVILREAEGEVAESTDMNELKPSRRGGTVDNDR